MSMPFVEHCTNLVDRNIARAVTQRLGLKYEAKKLGLDRAIEIASMDLDVSPVAINQMTESLWDSVRLLGAAWPSRLATRAMALAIMAGRMPGDAFTDILAKHRPIMAAWHEGAVAWFLDHTGMRPHMMPRLDNPVALKGKIVVVPPQLVEMCRRARCHVWTIDMPAAGYQELGPNEMNKLGARLVRHVRSKRNK